MRGSGNEKRALNNNDNENSSSGGKRPRREEGNVESQPSILKWMHRVPGPLQDVMKKRTEQLKNSQGEDSRHRTNSDRYSVNIATVFDHGPWGHFTESFKKLALATAWMLIMFVALGNIRISSLKCSVGSIVESDEALTKIPQLLVLLKSVRYVDEEIVAVLHDPTGEVEGYFHRELVEQIGPALVAGVGILLSKVSVFTPTDAPVTGRRKSYLNIIPRNIRQVFVPKEQMNMTTDDPVSIFNKEKEIEAAQDSDVDDNQTLRTEQAAQQSLQQSTMRNSSAELTYLSQRQVIHRNPPVRVDSASSTTVSRKGAALSKAQGHETGLGKWQWSKLLRKTTNGEASEDGSRMQERQSFLDASSRLVRLITKQNTNQMSCASSTSKKESPASPNLKKTALVRFESQASISRKDNLNNGEEELKCDVESNLKTDVDNNCNNSDGEDEDDDW
ncbi:hypothetical protein Plhal710r2_c030g0111271 [Plasmopara halstedii]